MSEELLPCPFCGKPAEFLEDAGSFQAECSSTHCRILRSTYGFKQSSAAIWNRRAQLAAVTQERDNLAAARDRALSRIHENLDPDHNPANLTPEQYGAADGWRLLKRSEINTRGEQISEIECWNRVCKNWITYRFYGACDDETYRTRLSVAELAALRAKGAE